MRVCLLADGQGPEHTTRRGSVLRRRPATMDRGRLFQRKGVGVGDSGSTARHRRPPGGAQPWRTEDAATSGQREIVHVIGGGRLEPTFHQVSIDTAKDCAPRTSREEHLTQLSGAGRCARRGPAVGGRRRDRPADQLLPAPGRLGPTDPDRARATDIAVFPYVFRRLAEVHVRPRVGTGGRWMDRSRGRSPVPRSPFRSPSTSSVASTPTVTTSAPSGAGSPGARIPGPGRPALPRRSEPPAAP